MTNDEIIVYYCKAYKKTCNPIVVTVGGKEITTDNVIFENGLVGEIKFNNTSGKIKSRGATTVLKIPIVAEEENPENDEEKK